MGRQLDQNRSEKFFQSTGHLEKSFDRGARIFQTLHVGAVAAEFQHIAKFRRSLLAPGIKRFRGRQPIEGVVDLDRVKILRVVSEPMANQSLMRDYS